MIKMAILIALVVTTAIAMWEIARINSMNK